MSEPYLNYNKKHKVGKYLTENFKSKTVRGANGHMKIPKNKYLVLGIIVKIVLIVVTM